MYSNFPENDYRNYLMHYSEGQRAKSHKYLYIDSNGNYVYPEDVRKVGIGAAAKGIANRAKTGITSAVQKGRTALASRSAKNKDRSAYRSTGKNKLQRAQSDINGIWQKNYGPSSGSNYKRSLRDRVGSTTAHIKNRTSAAMNRIKSSKLYGRAMSVLNPISNKASRAVGNATTKAKFNLRRARINTKKGASELYNRAKNVLSTARQNIRNASRSAYRETGRKGIAGLATQAYNNWQTNRKNKKKGKYASRSPR